MAVSVPFNDLSRLPSQLRDEIVQRIGQVISSGSFILGPEVEKFEIELANYLGCTDAVGVATGTDAILLSLLAADVGTNDVVLTMANAGSYTTIATRAIGAEPVFVDVAANSLQMTLSNLKKSLEATKAIGLKPKAVVVTHLFGQLNSEIIEIAEFANSQSMILIEDCAQSIGASNGSRLAGSFGALSTYSFFPTKNLGALGDAGAVSGKDNVLLSKIRKLRQYGWGQKYSIEVPLGRNSRLDEIQAAILRMKLPIVSDWNKKRREIYTQYKKSAGTKVKFYSDPNDSFVGHLCPITVEGFSQQQLGEHFTSRGIATSVHFPVPDHKQSIELKYRNLVDLPETEISCSRLVTIPLFPELTDDEIATVSNALSELN
jgi:dTDP-4-amino-4,6-dideoxygalactose transaminase